MRYLNSFFLTVLIYVSIATLFLFANPFEKLQSEKKEEKKIRLNYVQIVKPKPEKNVQKNQTKAKELVVEKKVKKVITKPKKIETKKIVKAKVKKKIVKKVEKKKIVKKTKKEIVKNIPKKINKPKNTPIEKVVTKQIKKPINPTPIKKVVNYEEDFLANHLHMIKKEIQKNIMYSKRARKLKIEGKVLVEFCLTKSGEIKRVKTLKGHKLLQKSTIEAIYSASANFPKVQKTITIRVPIEYRLI